MSQHKKLSQTRERSTMDGRGTVQDFEHTQFTQERPRGLSMQTLQVEKCKLLVVEGPNTGVDLEISKPIVRIGTNERNDLVLEDNTASRFHCEIRRIRDEYLLVDNNSTNGTYVGELKLREGFLYPNCELNIGNSKIRFVPLVEEVKIQPIDQNHYGRLVGASEQMKEVYGLLDKVAPSELTVVVTGETGTGKELIARAIHDASPRKDAPFVTFDCSAFPENLLESELFGHEKGAFSGAVRTHRGVFERANEGTLFFDELGEMSPQLQPKFLRALESGEIRRVGAERMTKIDVRVVAATNRNLVEMVEEGKFRRDLFYRLAKAIVTLPPLRTRMGDIPLLVDHFVEEFKRDSRTTPVMKGFADDAMEVLTSYDWPGNVRELRNVMERTIALSEEEWASTEQLPHSLRARTGSSERTWMHRSEILTHGGLKVAKERMVAQFEREYLVKLLERNNQNISQVAREAGIDRRHVYRLLKKYDLEESARKD